MPDLRSALWGPSHLCAAGHLPGGRRLRDPACDGGLRPRSPTEEDRPRETRTRSRSDLRQALAAGGGLATPVDSSDLHCRILAAPPLGATGPASKRNRIGRVGRRSHRPCLNPVPASENKSVRRIPDVLSARACSKSGSSGSPDLRQPCLEPWATNGQVQLAVHPRCLASRVNGRGRPIRFARSGVSQTVSRIFRTRVS